VPRRDPPPHPDTEIMKGFPNQGDPFPTDGQVDPPEPPAPSEPSQETSTEKRLRELQERFDRQDQELRQLRNSIPPPQPKDIPPPPPKKSVLDNAEEDLYRDPKTFLHSYGQEIAEQVTQTVTKSLTSQYQRERGTQKFWDEFYQKHQDLRQDHDLVEVTLNSHLAEMSSMPVSQAMDKLADLTRDRILRYAGGRKPAGKKAQAEGSAPPTPTRPAAPQDEKILSISELIKRRRENRRRVASGA
jgi:hypothetical protein